MNWFLLKDGKMGCSSCFAYCKSKFARFQDLRISSFKHRQSVQTCFYWCENCKLIDFLHPKDYFAELMPKGNGYASEDPSSGLSELAALSELLFTDRFSEAFYQWLSSARAEFFPSWALGVYLLEVQLAEGLIGPGSWSQLLSSLSHHLFPYCWIRDFPLLCRKRLPRRSPPHRLQRSPFPSWWWTCLISQGGVCVFAWKAIPWCWLTAWPTICSPLCS